MQACPAAGMNDHIAKPVNPDALYATLPRGLPARQGVAETSGVARSPRSQLPDHAGARWRAVEGLDSERGLHLFGGDVGMYLRVLRVFAEKYSSGVAEIDNALTRESQTGLGAAAHSLHGASASIGAVNIEQAAKGLEALCKGAEATEEARVRAQALQSLLIATARELLATVALEPNAS